MNLTWLRHPLLVVEVFIVAAGIAARQLTRLGTYLELENIFVQLANPQTFETFLAALWTARNHKLLVAELSYERHAIGFQRVLISEDELSLLDFQELPLALKPLGKFRSCHLASLQGSLHNLKGLLVSSGGWESAFTGKRAAIGVDFQCDFSFVVVVVMICLVGNKRLQCLLWLIRIVITHATTVARSRSVYPIYYGQVIII